TAGTVALLALYLGPALAPELGWDALTYHLRAPSHFLAAHRVYLLPYSPGSFYPFLAEMWSAVAMAFGGDAAAKLVNFGVLVLTASSLAAFGAELGEAAAGRLAALLYVAIPAAGVLAGQTYNDLETAWLVLLAVRLSRSRTAGDRMAAGALCGAAMGCKLLGAWALPACAVLWIKAPPLAGARGQRRALGALTWPLAAVAAVFIVWPLKNWLWTGNPLYPMFPGLFPHGGWNPYLTAEQAGRFVPGAAPAGAGALALALVRFPWAASLNVTAIGVRLTPLLAGLLPALLLPAASRPGIVGTALAGAWYAALWVAASAGEGRYLMEAAALLVLPAANAPRALGAGSRPAGAVVAAAIAATVALQAGHWTEHVSRLYVPWRVVLGLEPRELY
ncbi:MAG: hypothetical protein AAB368_14535, partial [bacterium]